jgi:hypothetical protein
VLDGDRQTQDIGYSRNVTLFLNYEAKKLKLRRAMANGTLHQETPQAQTDAERQQALDAAVEGDNWSAVIREQTQDKQFESLLL